MHTPRNTTYDEAIASQLAHTINHAHDYLNGLAHGERSDSGRDVLCDSMRASTSLLDDQAAGVPFEQAIGSVEEDAFEGLSPFVQQLVENL